MAIWNRALSAEEVLAACEARSPLEVFAGPVIVTREAQTDRIVLGEADVLKGSILNESYEITTVFGKLTVPASRVAGLAPAGGSGSWLVLADGQRLLGPLAEPALRIKLSVGATLSIPLARIRQAGYRLPDRPAEPATLPLAILRDGQRVLVSEISPALTLRTDCGEVAMAPRGLRSLEPAPAPAPPGAHRATFLNGSTLTGRIGPDKFNLTLALGVRAFVEREQFQGLLSPGGPSQLAPEAATLLLRNGDKLIGLVEDANLTVAHEFGPVAFPPGAAKALTFAPAGGAAVAVELWDGSRLTGRLTDPAVTFTVSGFGPTVKAPAAQIAAITRAVALPPPEVLDKVEGLIRQLGSGTAAAREAATRALAGMGKGIAPILRRYGADPDPEIAQRIQIILTDLGATPGEDQPPTPEAPRP
ncbi:MAG: hypothetical protein NT031_18305 [Planctomycetota bacterium]|nr:hypothetical protein [Planctomycetota bacterium]